jgi:hypothetical protein
MFEVLGRPPRILAAFVGWRAAAWRGVSPGKVIEGILRSISIVGYTCILRIGIQHTLLLFMHVL